MNKKWNIGTVCVQGGYRPAAGEPRILPIIQSTTYKYDDADQLANLFDLKAEGHIYSRISNPTVAAVEEKITILENGVGALATSSGQAATTLALLNICKSGDHVLATSTLYGGTFTLLSTTFKAFGIEVSFVDPALRIEELTKHIKANTKAVFGETIGNPSLNLLDIEKFSMLAKIAGVPLVIDNTLATPYLCNPINHGANIVIHSATKYIDGHATSLGGFIVDGGNFDWTNGKFSDFTEPDASYHGIQYTHSFKELAYIIRARVKLLRDLGATLSPFNAFLLNIGLETLHLRMKQHCDNALQLAEFLSEDTRISWVNYPKISSSYNNQLVDKYLPKGGGGILTFGIKGGREAAKKFINSLGLAALVTHLGDARTSVIHPASTTHRQLSDEELKNALVTPDMIRVSIGIEDIEDIIDDFHQAIEKAVK